MNLRTFAAEVASQLGLKAPTTRQPSPSPRSDPPNLLSTAKASDLQSAARAAERGDPKNLFTLYRDFVLSDEHVQSCLNTRKLAVLGQPLSIMPRSRGNPDDLAAAAACNRAVADCENWLDGLGALLDSHAFWPVSTAEKLFTAAGLPLDNEPALQYTLRRIEPITPHQLCWKWAYQAGVKVDMEQWEPLLKLWPLDLYSNILYDVTKAESLDPDRHIVHRGHLLTGVKDNCGGPGRAILGWIFLRSLGRDWFGRFMERYGNPFVKAKTDKNDPQAVAFLQEAFSTASKISGLIIDHEDEAELVQAMVQGGAEGHQIWHNVCNNAISRHITGYGLSDSPAGLNAGQSQKSENVREDVRMFDQLRLAATLERQLFAQFLRINGLIGRIKVSFGGLSDDDVGKFATSLNTMNQAGWEPTDEAIPTINERLGIPMQRKAAPSFGFGASQFGGSLPTGGSPSPQPFAARDLHGRLIHYSAGGEPTLPRVTHPSDAIAAQHAREVGRAMNEAFAPVVELLQSASSAQDAERRLAAYFADWRPRQFITALEKPLQLAAASGAAAAKP